MNAEWKQKWLEALRSGKYQQGKDRLRKADGSFCCLGVLCDLYAPEAWQIKSTGESYTTFGHQSYLPDDVASAVGMSCKDADMPMKLNDEGKSFAQIADYIERTL